MAAAPTAQRTSEARTLTGVVEATSRDGTGLNVGGEWVPYGDFSTGPRPELPREGLHALQRLLTDELARLDGASAK